MADFQFNINEYGYVISRTLEQNVSTANTVELVCTRGNVEKVLTGTVAGDGMSVDFTIPQGHFDTPGIWSCPVKATFASRISWEKENVMTIEITQ